MTLTMVCISHACAQPEKLAALIKQCLEENPAARPSFTDIGKLWAAGDIIPAELHSKDIPFPG